MHFWVDVDVAVGGVRSVVPYLPEGAGVVPVIVEASSFAGNPVAPGTDYRVPGSTFEAYVVHKGDEIDMRLDYRTHGPGGGRAGDIELQANA